MIDLTDSLRPWREFVARTSDNVRDSFVVSGVMQFLIEMRGNFRCPYTGQPQPNCVAVYHNIDVDMHLRRFP